LKALKRERRKFRFGVFELDAESGELCREGKAQPRLRDQAFLLPLDEMWALAPFLIVHKIGFGLALAATAALLYLPFSQRSLLLMGFSVRPTSD